MDEVVLNGKVLPKGTLDNATDDGVANPDMQVESIVEIKPELMIKEELDCHEELPMEVVPRHWYSDLAVGLSIDKANNGLNVEDLYSTHMNLEAKAETEVDSKVELKPRRSEQLDENDTSNKNFAMNQQLTKGDAAPTSSNGKSKNMGMGLKGRAKAVINAAHRKQSAANKTKKQHKCSSCDYVTPVSTNLKMHIRKHTGEKPFSCNVCAKRFTQKSSLQAHLKIHTDGKYLFRCPVCLKRFARNEEKSQHEATCVGRRFECHLCKKFSTPNKHKMMMHMRIHTGERPFRCDFCSKKFTLKDNLKKHLKIHTNPRPVKFQCLVCARKFLQEDKKQEHEIKCKRRRYECYICKIYVTSQKHYLSTHMRYHHTGVKPFQCEVCQKSFTQEIGLKRHHIRKHK